MRALAIVRIVVAAAIVVGAVAIAQWGGVRGDAHQVLRTLFDHASGLSRQVLIGLIIAAPIVLVLTLTRLVRRNPAAPAQILSLFNGLAPVVGVAAAALDLAGLLHGASLANPPSPVSMAPTLAEASLILGIGLLVGAVAALPKGASWNGGDR